ncbi:MAG: FtsW/RodA/SpoVE family cell cycle protein [Lachnospiraceae bacterium]|nr:FtsW/RodA/SpoVE family cell cycle protein [Lachnospiraceae bacterium]
MFRQYRLKDYNFRLVLWLIVLSSLGVLLVGSAEPSLQTRQLAGVIAGIIIMLIVSVMDYSWIMNFYWVMYFGNLLMLAAVRLLNLGNNVNGATRWLTIAGIRFQPVELSKIILIIFFAKYFMEHENDLNSFTTVLRSLLLIALPLILILSQPDLKNTITVAVLFAVMYYIAGLSYKYIFGVLCIFVPVIIIFMSIVVQPDQTLIKDYQRKRIMAFLNPDSKEYTDDTTQQNNSVIAIGSGELSGKGLNNNDASSANKGDFIAEIQTDFIFTVAGEELGFLGSAGIVILLLLISLECLLISMRAKDLSGQIICCGMATLISVQSFINIGVATRILPNTGTPLPFVSYGLTSLLTLFLGMGLVLNAGLQTKIRISPEMRRLQRERGRVRL